MSSVSTGDRIAAWNVEFLDSSSNAFAGLFQAKDIVTYDDAFNELQLCFDVHIHNDLALWRIPAREEAVDITLDDVCISSRAPLATLQQPVHLDYPFDLDGDLLSTKYAVVNHNERECFVRQSADLGAHVRARCAHRIYEPQTRQPPWYRRIGTASDDPKILSSTPRRSRSPKKRSGTSSPQKPGEVIHEAHDPQGLAFTANKDLQRHMDAFRENAQSRAICCAVSGLGKKWSGSGGLGPSLQACHIVPQKLWDLYPLAEDHEGEVELYSSRRLESKWNKTWGVDNCLWMQSSIHTVHDLRLLAINPNTLKVRCFAPYDLIYPYHTQAAHIKPRNRPDPAALKFHWDSCVYESMTAKIPWRAPSSFGLQSPHEEQEVVGDDAGRGSSPKRQRFFSGEGLSGVSMPILHGQGQTGAEEVILNSTTSPPKQMWLLSGASLDDISTTSLNGQNLSPTEADIMPELHMSDSTTPLCVDSEVEVMEKKKEVKKTRWSLGSVLSEKEEDGNNRVRYITPENHQIFLADVNWELKRGCFM